jgi:hypothetical protein
MDPQHLHLDSVSTARAYGAVLYIRSNYRKEILVWIVCTKNRLAPLKKVTLPRLELIAALIGARLLHYFCKATEHSSAEATMWSDSTVALGWICNDPCRWKTFVANRVTEIHTYTTPSQWKHCPGEDNPGDYLSRGVTEQLDAADLVARPFVVVTRSVSLAKPTNPEPSPTAG